MALTPSSSASVERRINKRPSALACSECRRKHLKCDTTSPPCSRCVERGLLCKYTPSRRGHRTAASSLSDASTGLADNDHVPLTLSAPLLPLSSATVALGSTAYAPPEPMRAGIEGLQPQTGQSGLLSSSPSASSQGLTKHEEGHLANLYYLHFHPTHPVLLPRSCYETHPYPSPLRLVVQLIGSQFTSAISNHALKAATEAALAEDPERSAYVVQSLLLYAIVLFAGGERAKAVRILSKASDLAIELGLNKAEFATTYGMQDVLFEESLRRTWWELFVVDGYCAALHRKSGFICNTVQLTAQLPCEESVYREGSPCGQAGTLDQFDMRLFADVEQPFSSACYRIEAIRIMGRILALSNGQETGNDDIQSIDNAIAAWKLNIPYAKAGIIDRFGEVDQMMFQAHAFTSMASIILHFPRSELPLALPTAVDIACAGRMTQASPTSAQHATKAILTSKDLSDLASLPVDKHSPLFICGIVFGCIVQLSACLAHPYDALTQHRDRIALLTGLLKCLGRQWTIALDAVRPLQRIANDVFRPLQTLGSSSTPSQHDSGFDMTGILDNVSWLDFFPADGVDGQDTLSNETWCRS